MKNYIFLTLIALIGTTNISAQNQTANLLQKEVKITEQIDINYLFFEPSNNKHTINGKKPLIIFLHGAGERGTDIEKVKVHGPPMIVETDKDFGFYVLSPQCRSNKRWNPKLLSQLLDEVLANNKNIDQNRIYLTGLSMGGYGTYDWAILEPNRFAAIAPICGGSATHTRLIKAFKHIPIWIFHGAMDEVVPVNASIEIAKLLKKAKADIQFTIYPFVNHNSWTETYENPELYKWFLSNSLNK